MGTGSMRGRLVTAVVIGTGLLTGCAVPVSADPAPATTHTITKGKIGDGIWTIGSNNVEAGTYQPSSDAGADCYWEIDAKSGEILKAFYGGGMPKIALKTGQVFTSRGCP